MLINSHAPQRYCGNLRKLSVWRRCARNSDNKLSLECLYRFSNSWIWKCQWQPFARLTTTPISVAVNAKSKSSGGKYVESLNLPQMPYALSEFKPDGRCNERENYIHKIADFKGLYAWQQENNSGATFTIHDGPPYANGVPHVGHALNKIIKDVINRYRVLRGHKVDFVPGWDCHGLPIETKARTSNDFSISDIDVREQADKFSKETMKLQREEFKQWGVMADWDRPYVTSDPNFVTNELDVFQQLHDKGLIYQDYMPVYWSPSSRTALAEAELDYNSEHKSQAVYVKLPLLSLPDHIRQQVKGHHTVHLVIWTTTPWTLPANKAVCYSTDLRYSLLHRIGTDEYLIVASDLVQSLSQKLECTFNVISSFTGERLSADLTYQHPVYSDVCCPLLSANHVTADVGSGLVHTAPAHGHHDFKVALQHGLSTDCMVDEEGRYTDQSGQLFTGQHVFVSGNDIVMETLGDRLMHSEEYIHKYPYDWRTKEPVLIRASRQWFIDTKRLMQPALLALNDVEVYPPVYKSTLCDTVSQRPYWCISRQRAWGVPIPAFQDPSGKAHVHRSITDHVRALIAKEGADIWWKADDSQLLPDHIRAQAGIPADLELSRGRDILDIWFDSGVSWSAVLGPSQADLYIEGVDQIRGWFQSSLLTSVALTGRAPYKGIMMHGFSVDEKGQKMSKSVGNVVCPSDVIYGNKTDKKGYGVDVLRWWAASKYSVTTVDIGPTIIKQCNDKMHLLRKRMRFILGNLYDFNPRDSLVEYDELPPQDQYFLHLLHDYGDKVTQYYEANEMSSVQNKLELFMTAFSNLYVTLSKDRLYCFPTESRGRRSAQTVLHHTLEVLVRSVAPITPFFSEDCYVHRHANQLNKGQSSGQTVSLFRAGWYNLDVKWNQPELAEKFEVVYTLADEIKRINNNKPIEMVDVLFISGSQCSDVYKILKELQGDSDDGECSAHSALCEAIQCANVCLYTEDSTSRDISLQYEASVHLVDLDVKLFVKEASHFRCERCRRYTATVANEPCTMCLHNIAHTWAS